MRTPEDYRGLTGVLNTAMVIVTCLYTATGFYGYMKTYGVSGSITLDLPTDDWSVVLIIKPYSIYTGSLPVKHNYHNFTECEESLALINCNLRITIHLNA